jgi:hypothetical protein
MRTRLASLAVAVAALLSLNVQPAAADPLIWVMPSGCIGISPAMIYTDPVPWIFVHSPLSYRNWDGRWFNRYAYRNHPYPTPDEFMGHTREPGYDTTSWPPPSFDPWAGATSTNEGTAPP